MNKSMESKSIFNRYEKIMIGLGLGLLVFFLGYSLGRSTVQIDESNLIFAEVVDRDSKAFGKKVYGRDVLPEIWGDLSELEREKYRIKRVATERKLVELLNTGGLVEAGASISELSTSLEGLSEYAKERGIDLAKLNQRQRHDLEGNFRILKSQLAKKAVTKEALADGKVEWGIVPQYHRESVEVAAGVMSPLVGGGSDHRVVVFANYHCPVCGSLWGKLDEVVAKSGGKASVHLRYYVQEGDASVVRQTALAGYCMDEQKKLSEFHRFMRERAPTDVEELLKRVGEIPGLAQKRFESCWKARMTEQKLERDSKDGVAIGVPGQAIAVVNGVPLQAQESVSEYLILIRR